jgi:hypothetical protein
MPDFGRRAAGGGDPSLDEINRADRFFEALAAKQPVFSTDPAEAELAFLFSGLRDEVRDAPVTAPVSHHDAIEALDGGLARNRGPRRSFAIVGSVAAAMLCIGGFGTAVYGAGPGDSLYGMRTAIFGQQEATRDDQVSLASAQLQQVQQLIDQGQWQQAQDKLVEVSSAVQGVDQVESKQQLVEQWNALTYKVVEQDPAATLPPGEPLPVLPSSPLTWLPMPVVEAPTSETTTSETATTSETTTTSETATTSDTTSTTASETAPETTGPSDTSVVPPEILMTAPSGTPTTAPPGTTAPTGPTATTSTVVPSSPTTITTTTTTTLPPRAPEATAQTSAVPAPTAPTAPTSTVAELPSSQPRLVPSSSAAPPAASTPASASETPSRSSQQATSTAAPERPSAAPTTTTVLPEG